MGFVARVFSPPKPKAPPKPPPPPKPRPPPSLPLCFNLYKSEFLSPILKLEIIPNRPLTLLNICFTCKKFQIVLKKMGLGIMFFFLSFLHPKPAYSNFGYSTIFTNKKLVLK